MAAREAHTRLTLGALGLLIAVSQPLAAVTPARLALKVDPRTAYAPATVVVQVLIMPRAENRILRVGAFCGEVLSRASATTLDGLATPALQTWTWTDLEACQYLVLAQLEDARGQTFRALEAVTVLP